jgi:hypothetical protein
VEDGGEVDARADALGSARIMISVAAAALNRGLWTRLVLERNGDADLPPAEVKTT